MVWVWFPHYRPYVGGPVTGAFPHKGSTMQSFGGVIYFSLCKLWNKHSMCRWFERPWRADNVIEYYLLYADISCMEWTQWLAVNHWLRTEGVCTKHTHRHVFPSLKKRSAIHHTYIYIICMYHSHDLCTNTMHPYSGDTISNAQWMMVDLRAVAKLSNRTLIMSCFCDRNEIVNMEARCIG